MQAKDPSAAYTPHVAIIIDGNEALASFCTGSGTGTESDPYVIEGFSITGYPIGISILNTDAYLCIRGNEIKHQTEKGIYVAGAQNVNISNNVFVNASYAAYIDTCQNIEYSWNTITDSQCGFYSWKSNNMVIKNNTVQRCVTGAATTFSNNYQLSSNKIEECEAGISIGGGNQITITNNSMSGGIFVDEDVGNITADTSNKVGGKTLRFYAGQNDISLLNEADVGQLVLLRVNNSQFRGLSVSFVSRGVLSVDSHYNTFAKLHLTNNSQGMHLVRCSYNTITSNVIENNCNEGLYLQPYAYYNEISGNLIKNNKYGLRLDFSDKNRIFNNSFYSNDLHVVAHLRNNTWDNGEIGNYWDDYEGKCPGASNDGNIWYTPYLTFTEGSYMEYDRYPLVDDPRIQLSAPSLTSTSNVDASGIITITLQWDPVEGANYYLVYRSDSEITNVEGLSHHVNITETEYSEMVPVGKWYYAVVAAYGSKRSNPSNNIQIQAESQGEDPADAQIDGFPLAILGIVCAVTLMIKKRRINI